MPVTRLSSPTRIVTAVKTRSNHYERNEEVSLCKEPSSPSIERRLTTLFPSETLEDHAEDVGVVGRNRDLQVLPLVWSLVFGFTAGESRTLADFRRSYNSTADDTLCPSGLYQRLTPTLAEYLRDLVEHGIDEVAVPSTVASCPLYQ